MFLDGRKGLGSVLLFAGTTDVSVNSRQSFQWFEALL